MKISLCITCYDQDYHHVESRILGLKQQTRHPDEVLVVCSGLEKLEVSDPNVKVYTFPARMSAGAARNKGGELATGDVVCFCDADDPIHPQKCEVIKRVFDNKDVDALLHNYNTSNVKFEEIDTQHIELEKVAGCDHPPSKNVYTDSDKPIAHGPISIRKEVTSEITYGDSSFGEDGLFCQSIFKSPKYSLYYTPLCLINYYN